MAKQDRNINVIGLEIRRPLVDFSLQRKISNNLENLHYFSGNANIDLARILTDIVSMNISIESISIQFPDPQFKTRNKKRRVVNEELVQTIAKYTSCGCKIYLQSDILDVEMEMVDHFAANQNFSAAPGYSLISLMDNNPAMPCQTEREIATIVRVFFIVFNIFQSTHELFLEICINLPSPQAKGLPVYRMLFDRV